MKVWIARDGSHFDPPNYAVVFAREPRWIKEGGYWQRIHIVQCPTSLRFLKQFGVRLKPGECKQYDIPMFREVKPKARKR